MGPPPKWKNEPKIRPRWMKPLKFRPYWAKWSITISTVKFWSEFAVPAGFYMPTGMFVLYFIPTGNEISTGSMRQGCIVKKVHFHCINFCGLAKSVKVMEVIYIVKLCWNFTLYISIHSNMMFSFFSISITTIIL